MKRNIQSRGMDIDTRCPVCYRSDEDGCHLLFKCKFAKLVWRELMLEDKRISLAGARSSKDVFRLIWQWDENSQNLIVVTLWMLWSSRNGTNAGEPTRTLRVIAGQILGHCMDFKLL
jgi:hypothetical protein